MIYILQYIPSFYIVIINTKALFVFEKAMKTDQSHFVNLAYNDTPDTQSHGITVKFEGDRVKGGVNPDSVSETGQDSEGYTNKGRDGLERNISTVSEGLTTSSTQ